MAYSVAAGGGETYFSAFALFLRASAPQVALVTTLPPLLGSFAQLLSAWLGQILGRRALILVGAATQSCLWLLILFLPMRFPDQAVVLLLILLAMFYGAGSLSAPQWTSLMRDMVSERRRGRYFAHRTRLTTIASFTALIAGGLILHGFDTSGRTALGFATVFVGGFVARAISVYHLTFLKEPESATTAVNLQLRELWTQLRASGAVGFSVYFVSMNLAVAIASPFFAVYMLRDLEFSYLQFMANTGMSVLVQVLTLNTWGRIGDVYGHRLILIVTSMSIPLVPALWMLSNDFWYLLLVQCVAGLSWGGFSLGASNLLFELLPRTQRVAYLAFHNIATAGAVFAGGMIGAIGATRLPTGAPLFGDSALASNLIYLFAVSAVARMGVALVGARRVRQLRTPRRVLSPQALVLRVTGFNAFLGLLYELIGAGERELRAVEPRDAREAGDGDSWGRRDT